MRKIKLISVQGKLDKHANRELSAVIYHIVSIPLSLEKQIILKCNLGKETCLVSILFKVSLERVHKVVLVYYKTT